MNMMSNFTNSLTRGGTQLFSSSKFWIITGLAVLFIGIAFYIYQTYILPRLEPTFVTNAEMDDGQVSNADGSPGEPYAEIYFFHTSWCPYSKEAMPIWQGLKKKLNNTRINKHTLLFKEIDGESEESKIHEFEDEYKKKIDGFPTIMIVKDEQVVDFEAEVNTDNLTEFIQTVL